MPRSSSCSDRTRSRASTSTSRRRSCAICWRASAPWRGFEVHDHACLATADAGTALGYAYQAARFALAATSLGLGDPALFLDRDDLWSQYCLTAHIDEVGFPSSLRPGHTAALELQGGYRLGGGPLRTDPRLRCRVAFEGGGGLADLTGYANASGAYVVDVTWPALADTLTLNVAITYDAPLASGSDGACVGLDGFVDHDDIRSSRVVVESGVLPAARHLLARGRARG